MESPKHILPFEPFRFGLSKDEVKSLERQGKADIGYSFAKRIMIYCGILLDGIGSTYV